MKFDVSKWFQNKKLPRKEKTKRPRKLPKWVIPVVAAVAAAAVGVGIFVMQKNKSQGKTVYVYGIDIAGMTDYWGDTQQTSGRVQSDNVQTVMVSDTQKITKIHVSQGDTVKKGDILLSYDTTLTELSLEKKRLAVEQLKLQLQEEEDRLTEIRNLQPYTPREDDGGSQSAQIPAGDDFTFDHFPDYAARGDVAVEAWITNYGTGYDGSSPDSALICWTKEGAIVDDTLANEMGSFLQRYRYLTALDEYNQAYLQFQQDYAQWEASEEPEKGDAPTAPTKPEEGDFQVRDFYMIVKSTYENKTLYYNDAFQGLHVYLSSSGFFYIPFNTSEIYDYTRPPEQEAPPSQEDTSAPDPGPFYTLAEIVQMKEEQQKKILDVKYQIKIAEAEYDIARREANDGSIKAQVDGKVVSLLTEEEARAQKAPIIKVSGGGGYTLVGSISELNRDKLEIGSEVNITDYRNGTACMGTVQSIGDYPVSTGGYYYGDGNPNASSYPFTVFVDESENLVPGYYVDMQYSLTDSVEGIYLSKPFVRTEKGRSYVYVRGENGRLEQRDVVTGKIVWGSYYQILSGVTAEDYVAFPYGKNVKAGAPTEISDYRTLYG